MKNKIVGLLLVSFCILGLFANVASAKDEVLLQEMVNLEKAYIPVLFYTSQPEKVAEAKQAMTAFRNDWNLFFQHYYDYKPDYVNWLSYFMDIDSAVREANDHLTTATIENPFPMTLAHDALERIRITMLSLRPNNGFSKFITDKMTVYHEPMKQIVVLLKTETVTPTLIEEVRALHVEADKAWSAVEKCPVDPGMWGFDTEQMQGFYFQIFKVRTALNYLSYALESGDPALIQTAGTDSFKRSFVSNYVFLADIYLPFIRPPAP